jgi:hypothetical protein
VAVEVAAGLCVAFGDELSLGFAAPLQQSVGGGFPFMLLPLQPLAHSAKVDDVAHSALDQADQGVTHVTGWASMPNAPIARQHVPARLVVTSTALKYWRSSSALLGKLIALKNKMINFNLLVVI